MSSLYCPHLGPPGCRHSLKMIHAVKLAVGSQRPAEPLYVLGQEATVCQPARGQTHSPAVTTRH